MPFNRPPRIQTPLPDEKIIIPDLPPLPSKPDSGNWMMIALPLGATLLSVVLMFAFIGNNSSALNYLLFLPIMLVSYLTTFITSSAQKKNYEKKVVNIRKEYRGVLRNVEDRIIKLQETELKIRQELDPEPGICIQKVQRQDSTLGERRPDDPDFLKIRLGLGKQPAAFKLEYPTPKEKPEEFVKEYEFVYQLVEKYSMIDRVPIHARLGNTISLGVSGSRPDTLSFIRAFISQVTTNHWPGEVQLLPVNKPSTLADWAWLSGLPHLSPLFKIIKSSSPTENDEPSQSFMTALEAELQRREQLFIASKLGKPEQSAHPPRTILPRLILVCDHLPITYNHPALNLAIRKGAFLGIHVVYMTEKSEKVLSDCGAIINISSNQIEYGETGDDGYKVSSTLDQINPGQAEMLSKAFAAIQLLSTQDTSAPPATITFLDMFKAKKVEDLPLQDWWDNQSPYGYLRTPIGKISDASDMIFDLNDKDGAHGPHGLIGGMTGSGKSEVLKAIILSLAVTHHPYDLTFALIDFKGGAAFNELAKLPHTVGIITDIESNATFAERVIHALSGEIERRKRLLEDARSVFRFGRSHIDEYRNLRVRRPLPRLLIVFDEFAEFKQRNPEESKKLISIARQGRSLGVHLILATQNIEAAIDPEILQNSNFRICLKVSEPQDSIQMVGIPDAINLTRGRAYFSSTNRMLFQSAFSGAQYDISDKDEFKRGIIKIWPDGRREVIDSVTPGKNKEDIPPATQASAVVERICEVAKLLHLKKPPAVWPEPLPERLPLIDEMKKYITGGWDNHTWNNLSSWDLPGFDCKLGGLMMGLSDLPSIQKQIPIFLDPGKAGHALILGSAGSGKSTIIRSMVTSMAYMKPPTHVNFYILDYGGQSSLKILENFPHVGAVVTRLERERTERLVQFIISEFERRIQLLRNASVDSWTAYNEKHTDLDRIPALYLLIDGFRDFKQAFDNEFIEGVTSLVSGGQAAGIFLIVSSSLQSDIPNNLYANINFRLTFNQADHSEYFSIVGQLSEAKQMEDAAKGVRPGRGLLRGTPPIEFQAFLPAPGDSDQEVSQNLYQLGNDMRLSWKGTVPEGIQTLPLIAYMSEGTTPIDIHAPGLHGIAGQDFEHLRFTSINLRDDGPTFLITGVTGKTGKTTYIQSSMLNLTERYSDKQLQILLIDFQTRSMNAFRKQSNILEYIGSKAGLEKGINLLVKEIEKRAESIDKAYNKDPEKFDPKSLLQNLPYILVVIDDYERFFMQTQSGEDRQHLAECVLKGGELGIGFMIAGTLSELPRDFEDPFLQRFRKSGCGVLLGGIEGIEEYNNTRRIIGQPAAGLPPGRGYFIRRGKARLIQAPAWWKNDSQPCTELENRLSKIKAK